MPNTFRVRKSSNDTFVSGSDCKDLSKGDRSIGSVTSMWSMWSLSESSFECLGAPGPYIKLRHFPIVQLVILIITNRGKI